MGRREKPVWKYFIKFKKDASIHARCNYCGKTYLSNASRMEKHLTTCLKAPNKIRKLYNKKFKSKNNVGLIEESAESSTSSVDIMDILDEDERVSKQISTSTYRAAKNQTLLKFVDSMVLKENAKIDTLLARAIFSADIPHQFLENDYVKKFIKALRPSYKLPSRYVLSTTLLEKEYILLERLVKDKIKNCDTMGLISDGWTDVNEIGLINIVLTTPEPVFYKAIDSKVQSHTGEYIASVLIQAIDEVGPQKVGVVITDNARNMKSAWTILSTKYPHIVFYGCAAHGLNLLCKDILSLSSISKVCAQVKEVIHFFRNTHAGRQALKEIQLAALNKEIQLLTFSETRWCSMSNSFDSVLKNKDFLQNAVFSKYVKPIIDVNLKRIILDEDVFWPKVTIISKLINPISHTITQMETDKPRLSSLCIAVKKLKNEMKENCAFISKTERDNIEVYLKNRCENFIQHPIQLAANLLDPAERGHNLTEEEQAQALEFILDYGEKYSLDGTKVMSDLANYRAKTDIWARNCFWKTVNAKNIDALTWWKGFFPNRELTKVACKIFSFPITATSAERNWKAFSNLHTKKRNKLTISRAMKLVYVKFNLQVFKDNDLEKLFAEIEKTPPSANIVYESPNTHYELDDSEESEGSVGIFYGDQIDNDIDNKTSMEEEDPEDTKYRIEEDEYEDSKINPKIEYVQSIEDNNNFYPDQMVYVSEVDPLHRKETNNENAKNNNYTKVKYLTIPEKVFHIK